MQNLVLIVKIVELMGCTLERRDVQVTDEDISSRAPYHTEAADILNGIVRHLVRSLKQRSLCIFASISHDLARTCCAWYRWSRLSVSSKVA